MESRADRMQQRMRGAGHGQIEDVSFQLDLGGDDLTSEIDNQTSPEVPPPRTTPTPNTSAKRRKLDTDAARRLLPRRDGASPSLAGKPDQSELQEDSPTESAQPSLEQQTSPNAGFEEEEPAELFESLPPLKPVVNAPPLSPMNRMAIAENTEVEESPVDAPGSGRRRKITSSALGSSVRLQDALSPEENATETVPISSPLERKVRRTKASTRRSTISDHESRYSAISATEAVDELPPDAAEKTGLRTLSPELSSDHHTQLDEFAAHPDPEPEPEAESQSVVLDEQQEPRQDHNENVTEEVDAIEAARRLGRKRPHGRSPRGPSAEPDSTIPDEGQEDTLPKRRKKPSQASPAKQKQGRPKATSRVQGTAAPKAGRRRKHKTSSDDPESNDTWAIPVQRFTKKQAPEGHDNADILHSNIPFPKSGGVTTIDVLAAMCDESIQEALNALKEGITHAEDRATKRERQIQAQALKSFREELRDRFLHQTILLDELHSLRKRVRIVKKQRIDIRDEIMRIKNEREEVAIQKDAVRIKHDKVKEEALSQLSLSSQMHDIDLAVERGRAAPELGPAEKKTAELANLEILISRITDQACTRSDTGGTLTQIKDFNAFLERAAVVLESR